MTKITNDSVEAFISGNKFGRGNMRVIVETNATPDAKVCMYQHGNLIAERPRGGCLSDTRLTNAGWYSATTKERLNALLLAITGSWTLGSYKGDWEMSTQLHGEGKPFHGEVLIKDLLELDATIQAERN